MMIAAALARRERTRALLRFLHEVPRRDADEQQQRANDRCGARDLHRLALTLGLSDRVEQRACADEIDALHRRHLDGNEVVRVAELRELRELLVVRTEHRALPDERVLAARNHRQRIRIRNRRGYRRARRRLPRRRRKLERDREIDRTVFEYSAIVLPLQELEQQRPVTFSRIAALAAGLFQRLPYFLRVLQGQSALLLTQLCERSGEHARPLIVRSGERAEIQPHLSLLLRRGEHVAYLRRICRRQFPGKREIPAARCAPGRVRLGAALLRAALFR